MLHTQSEHRCTPVKTPAFLLSLSAWLNLGPFFHRVLWQWAVICDSAGVLYLQAGKTLRLPWQCIQGPRSHSGDLTSGTLARKIDLKKGGVVKMPRSFLVKKKRGASGGWQWKEPEQLEWKDDDVIGTIFSESINDTCFCCPQPVKYLVFCSLVHSVIFLLFIFAFRAWKRWGAWCSAACPCSSTRSTISMCKSLTESAGTFSRSWEKWP